MMDIVFVAAGGFLGANCRYILTRTLQNKKTFPIGTLTVNLLGAFLMGFLFGVQINGHLYALFGVGFMGAFTTFSTFKLESEQLREKKLGTYFYSYLALSYVLGIGLAFMGAWIGKWI